MTKKITIIIAIVGIVLGFILLNPTRFGICQSIYSSGGYIGCLDETKDQIGGVIELFSIALFIISFILLFVRDEVFNAWFKFSRLWLPISLIFVFIASPNDGGVLASPSSRALLIIFSLSLFLMISLGIIIWKSVQMRGK